MPLFPEIQVINTTEAITGSGLPLQAGLSAKSSTSVQILAAHRQVLNLTGRQPFLLNNL